MTREPENDRSPASSEETDEGAAPRQSSEGEGGRTDPQAPTQLPASSWWQAVKRAAAEFRNDNLTDWAAALTYYSVLSIFPAVLVVVSIVGMAGKSVSQSLVTNVGQLAPGAVKQVLTSAITELSHGRGGAGAAALIGVVLGVWSASKYVAAFMRASNAIYDIPEGRPIWKTIPVRVGVTLVSLVLLSASAIAMVITGGIATQLGNMLGIGHAAVTAWEIAKWPVLLLVVSFLFALLYWASPNAKQGFRWVSPGGVLAIVVWLAASAIFALYVSLFNSYNKTYGSIAGIIVFLVWLWISNLALLLGAELNAELEHGRHIAEGHPASDQPYVALRDTSHIHPGQDPGLKEP